MKIFRGFILSLALVSSPALADKHFAVTPSGATEVLFDAPARQVIATLSNKCMDNRWQIVAATETQLTCEAPMSFGQSLLTTLAIGNSYSTPPRQFFRFNVAEINGVSRVQASGWAELQMAFGQTRRNDFSGASFHNSLTGFLLSSGSRLPTGTIFPNHALLGIEGDYVPHERSYVGLRVSAVAPGGAAEEAGVQVGDLIVRIANKRFKHDEDYLDATAAAASRPAYKIQVLRAGGSRPVELELRTVFRPAIEEPSLAEIKALAVAEQRPDPTVDVEAE